MQFPTIDKDFFTKSRTLILKLKLSDSLVGTLYIKHLVVCFTFCYLNNYVTGSIHSFQMSSKSSC
jgi:hypothetical protein